MSVMDFHRLWISKTLSKKYSQKLHDHPKKSTADALKATLKRVFQKTVEATGDLIGNKIASKIKSYKNHRRIAAIYIYIYTHIYIYIYI